MKSTMLSALLFALTLFASCSKTTEEIKVESDLLGKWTLKSWAATDMIGSQQRKSSGNYDAGEYMQFNAGGQAFIRVDDTITATFWKLLNENKTLYIAPAGSLDLSDDGYEIKTLTSHNLALNAKGVDGSNSYDMTIYLEK